MSQFIAQMFQAGALTECAAALLSFRYPSFTGKPEQNFTTKIHAKREKRGQIACCDELRDFEKLKTHEMIAS